MGTQYNKAEYYSGERRRLFHCNAGHSVQCSRAQPKVSLLLHGNVLNFKYFLCCCVSVDANTSGQCFKIIGQKMAKSELCTRLFLLSVSSLYFPFNWILFLWFSVLSFLVLLYFFRSASAFQLFSFLLLTLRYPSPFDSSFKQSTIYSFFYWGPKPE